MLNMGAEMRRGSQKHHLHPPCSRHKQSPFHMQRALRSQMPPYAHFASSRAHFLAVQASAGAPLVVLDIPLLYEKGLQVRRCVRRGAALAGEGLLRCCCRVKKAALKP